MTATTSQVLPRVNEEEIVNGQQPPPPQDARGVAFQTLHSLSEPSSTTPPASSSSPPTSLPTSLPQPQQGGVAIATAAATSTAGGAITTEDRNYDSDTEAPAEWSEMATKEEIQEGQIIKAGYLMKKGERLKIWKKKWFVLRTSKLAYYKDSKEYELLRIVDIRDVHRAAEVPVKHKCGVFMILTPRRTFTVQADSVAEMQDWIQAINQAKIQFEFAASSSDLESCAGSTVHLGQHDVSAATEQQPQQQPLQHHHGALGIILPRRQQRKSLSPSDPDLLDKREKSRQRGSFFSSSSPPTPSIATAMNPDYTTTTATTATTPTTITATTTTTTATTTTTTIITTTTTATTTPTTTTATTTPTTSQHPSSFAGASNNASGSPFSGTTVSSILDRPTPRTPTITTSAGAGAALSRRSIALSGAGGLSLITTGTQAMQIALSSSPRMEQVHSGMELPAGSFSSGHSFGTTVGYHGAAVPETPSSPGGYYSGGEMFWASHNDHYNNGSGNGNNYLSSGEEDVGDDPSIVEAGRLASEANAPGSGIVTNEHLESKVVRQGYLMKLGNKYKTWRKRWFVLRGDKLTYYKNTKEYQPHGIIPLSTIIDCLQTDPVSKSKQYCLRIVTHKRSFVCCAPEEDTLLQWLDALHVECDRVADEARQEAIADQKDIQLQRRLSQAGGEGVVAAAEAGQQDGGHDGDGEEEDDQPIKPMGRTARLKMNLHSSLPHRSRSRSKSGDANSNTNSLGLFGTSANFMTSGLQTRKVMSLDTSVPSPPASPTTATAAEAGAAAGTGIGGGGGNDGKGNNVTFHLPTSTTQAHSPA